MKKTLEFHPDLKDVPMMPLHEREALGRDIVENGQRFPIITIGGKIIDGRNRYLACIANNIDPKVIELAGQDPKKLVASANYFRKHWTTAERAHFAALMSLESERGNPETKDATPLNGSNELIPTQAKAAEQMGVSVASVKRAKVKIQGKKNERKAAKDDSGLDDKRATDDNGSVIPPAALPYWNRKPEAKNVLNQISACRGQVKKLEPSDPMWSSVNLNGVLADLNSAYNRFAAAIPAYVCPYCKGVKVDNCKCCKGKGVISKFVMSTVPEEIRNART
jgi:hypothetical protein